MLPKQHRLPLRTEFKRIKKEGKLFQGKFFSLLVAKQQLPAARFAFIISKKIDKKAVRRNRVRRLLSEAVQFWLPKIKLQVDVVFLAKRPLIGKDFIQIKKETERMFKKTGLFEK